MEPTDPSHYSQLYHGTTLTAGFAILREGVRLPERSRWSRNGEPIPLEHGLRFYTCVELAGSRQFARGGMILRFDAPLPMGRVSKIDPGPGGGFIQVSFGPEHLSALKASLSAYSIDGGYSWISLCKDKKSLRHYAHRRDDSSEWIE